MAVRLTNNQRKVKVPAGELRRAAERALTLLDLQGAELSVLITGDTRMRRLNRDYRGLDKTTDVLSFPTFGGGPEEVAAGVRGVLAVADAPPAMLGDIVISAPKAESQALERGHSLMDELVLLLVHGLLHLVGYDHEIGPDAARAMTRRTASLVKRLGEES